MPAVHEAGSHYPEVVYEFEARGVVRMRKTLEKMQTRMPSNFDLLYAKVRDRLAPLGVSAVENLYLDDDDTAANKQIGVTLGVRLRGRRVMAPSIRSMPVALIEALAEVTSLVTRYIEFDEQVRGHPWRLVNAEEFQA